MIQHDVDSKSSYCFLSSVANNSYDYKNSEEKVRFLTMTTNIHVRIKEGRIEAGLSQGKLAKMVGVSREAVSQWENEKPAHGKKPTKPNGENLVKLGKAINRSTDFLETGEGIKEYCDLSKEAVKTYESMYGWICPVCSKVNAPQITSCPGPHQKD